MGSARLRRISAGVGAGVSRRWVGSVPRDLTLVLGHVEPTVVALFAVLLFVEDAGIVEFEEFGRRRAFICHESVVPSVARDVGAVLRLGLPLLGPLRRRLRDVLDRDLRAG